MIIDGMGVPSTWEQYPKSFLMAAIPVLKAEGTFDKAWHKLAQLGITGLLKSGGCPVITDFFPVKKDMTTVSYSYVIKANPSLDYFVVVSIYDKGGKFIVSEISPKITNDGQIKSTKGEVGSVKLSVKPVGIDGVVDSKIIKFEDIQSRLF